jgi:hypothetical protein
MFPNAATLLKDKPERQKIWHHNQADKRHCCSNWHSTELLVAEIRNASRQKEKQNKPQNSRHNALMPGHAPSDTAVDQRQDKATAIHQDQKA